MAAWSKADDLILVVSEAEEGNVALLVPHIHSVSVTEVALAAYLNVIYSVLLSVDGSSPST